MNSVIRTQDVHKIYANGSEVFALNGISLEIEQGEFVAMMGPSGCGKTTFMDILGCLSRQTTGQYWFKGIEVNQLTDNDLAELRNREIGFVFQSFHLLPRTSALANIELPMIYAGVRRAERHARAMRALEQVGIAHRWDHFPNHMSGGERQRVAIARALINEPSLILADEPTGNLDSRSSAEIMSIFSAIHAQGKTIVMVTHEAEIAAYAGRVLHMRDGSLLEESLRRNAEVCLS